MFAMLYNTAMEDQKQRLVTLNAPLCSKTAGMAFTACTLAYLIFSVIFSAAAGGLDGSSDAYLYLSYLVAPVGIAVGSAVIMCFKRQKITSLAPVKCGVKYYLIALLMIFGLVFSLSNLNVATLKFLQLFGYVPRPQSSYLPDISGGKVALALFVIALLPAIFEEFLFRGLILRNLSPSAGDIRTVFLVGFCFSLFHASAEQTVYQFVCGCAFALLALRSGSILPCVLMHFLNNALIIIMARCGLIGGDGGMLMPPAAEITLIVLGALAFAGAVLWLILDKKPCKKAEKGGVANFFIFASAGIAALAIIWVCSFFGG